MTFLTGAGATFALSASAPASYTKLGYAAVVTTLVGKITAMDGVPSRIYNEVTVVYLASAGTDVGKGGYTLSATTLTVALDANDAGQALLQAANDSTARYTAKLSHPEHGDIYGQALIFGQAKTWGDNDTASTWEVQVRWKVATPTEDGIVVLPPAGFIPLGALTSPIDGFYITDPRPGFEGQYVTPPIGYAA
jgi:hypothetical protein